MFPVGAMISGDGMLSTNTVIGPMLISFPLMSLQSMILCMNHH